MSSLFDILLGFLHFFMVVYFCLLVLEDLIRPCGCMGTSRWTGYLRFQSESSVLSLSWAVWASDIACFSETIPKINHFFFDSVFFPLFCSWQARYIFPCLFLNSNYRCCLYFWSGMIRGYYCSYFFLGNRTNLSEVGTDVQTTEPSPVVFLHREFPACPAEEVAAVCFQVTFHASCFLQRLVTTTPRMFFLWVNVSLT